MTTTLRAAGDLFSGASGTGHDTGWWAMACVCGTEAAFFAYLITAYAYLATRATAWPPPGIARPSLVIPVVMTVALVTSSLVMAAAERAIRAGNVRALAFRLSISMGLGLVFVGLLIAEYAGRLRELLPQTHVYGSLFYVMTGMHGLHVIAGLLLIGYTLLRTLRGDFRAGAFGGVSVVALYWHFVDVVWLVLFTTLYLSPRFS
ncbi:MAG TPA: cytochrome c oxidase subunit 3 [Gemmatimonadales bacterium]|jgi:heme/copper-type cytochrome/quinol oxidase subunit 3